jgi:hypothetical protein
MAIKPIRRLPDDLPHARLYLDDIEQISKILRKSVTAAIEANQKGASSDHKPEIAVVYRIDDSEMDSLEDLTAYSHSTTNFRLTVTSDDSHGTEFTIRSFWAKPELNLSYPIVGDARWSVHAKIKAILEYRQLRFKNGILSWPNWLKVSFYVLVSMALPFILLLRYLPLLRIALCIVWAVLAATILYVACWPSRVIFVRSHERSKLSVTARQGYIKAVALMIVGGVIGKLIDLLFTYVKQRSP